MTKKEYTTNASKILDRRHPPSADDLNERAKISDEIIKAEELTKSLEMIAKSEADIEAGRTIDAREAIKQIAKKHNLKLDQ
jgi:hypothetical protein